MSFDPFGDFETAGHLRNHQRLKDPIEVKEFDFHGAMLLGRIRHQLVQNEQR
ncbi:Fic domain protein [Pseudomonas chlororaphis]|nr:Fic domain protein [Pseudomonas chlororaphis]